MDDKELETARQARNEYYRNYKKANKDKIKLIDARYWKNKANKTNEASQDKT